MASQQIAISVPAQRTAKADRIILAVALAFAVLSVLIALHTFSPRPSGASAINDLDAARPATFLAASLDR